MDVWRITVATLRRWYIFLPLLALTGWGVLSVGDQIDPEYQVSGTFILTPSLEETEIPDPYGGAVQATQVIAIVLNSPTTREQIVEMGLEPDYTVAGGGRSSTIMTVSVLGRDPEATIETGNVLIEMTRQELETRQSEAGIPPGAQYGLSVISAPAVDAVVYDGKSQIQAVVGVVGAAVALLAALLFDDVVGLIKRRLKQRRLRRSAQSGGASDGAVEESEVATHEDAQPLDDDVDAIDVSDGDRSAERQAVADELGTPDDDVVRTVDTVAAARA
ncbi:hypothetical protein [Occultella kanbiaonis]|uniref:hypothetical protein n=1 Tax=Occultella kanbiaonis TaxID=2675754 RepID=UPI0013D2AB6A|nr:hypothetical protein [Occultella kanbiaonis]